MQNSKKIEWILRISVAGEFIGHGLLAYGGKADWIRWISLMTGADASLATSLLLYVGLFDLLIALIILFRPIRAALLWATFWGFWTALVRPVVAGMGAPGVGWLDFVERFANFGAPLALLYLLGWPQSWNEWWK